MRPIPRQCDTFAYRIAAPVNQNVVTRLGDEFKDWHRQQPKGSIFGGGMVGGINEWPNIERFLKDRYPAAHRNLTMGHEQAGLLMDGFGPSSIEGGDPYSTDHNPDASFAPYETGPEAEAIHGYDPKEIAAGMLLLHNKSDRFRGDMTADDEARLDEIAQARNTEFDNADIDVLHDIAQKRHKMQHAASSDYDDTAWWAAGWDDEDDDDEPAHKTAMPAPAPKGLRFEHDPNFIHPHADYLGRVQAYVDDHPVGHLEWLKDGNPLSAITDRKPGEVSFIYVHPNYRRHSIASEMFDWVKENAAPDLHHSRRRTNLGDSWVEYEQQRAAAVDVSHAHDLTGRLSDEFTEWWAGKADPENPYHFEPPLNQWHRIEEFLHEKYPAAHRGLTMGMERAQPILDGYSFMGDRPPKTKKYETGPKAVAKHGYDPAEVVAGMLYLHNDHHRFRSEMKTMDTQRIMEIAQGRSRMQWDYNMRSGKPEPVIDNTLDKAAAVLDFASRLAMPAPLPDDVTFKYHHTNDSIPPEYSGVRQGGSHTFLAPAVAAYKNDKPVAYVEWWPTDRYPNAAKHYRHVMDKGKPGEVYYIYVHPDHRRNSIASEMFRWAKDNVEPDLHHSPKKSELGKKWVSYEESSPELARAAAVIRYAQRVAMPLNHIPPMNHFDDRLFLQQLHQLVYSDRDIAGRPERADTIHAQYGNAGKGPVEDFAELVSFIHHDENGAPTGILHYFPHGSNRAREKPGGIQVMVHPAHQGKGIGSKLLDAAMAQFGPDTNTVSRYAPIDLDNQNVTPGGNALIQRYLKRTAE